MCGKAALAAGMGLLRTRSSGALGWVLAAKHLDLPFLFKECGEIEEAFRHRGPMLKAEAGHYAGGM